MKYISMKIEPNGRMPAAGMTNHAPAHHAEAGIGLGILLTLHIGSYFPDQPAIVPTKERGNEKKIQIVNIWTITTSGMALIVS